MQVLWFELYGDTEKKSWNVQELLYAGMGYVYIFYFLKMIDALVSCEGEKQCTKLTAG